MTDQEIIVTIAERVMGWSWVKNCGWADKDRRSALPMYQTFNPLTNPAHWMMVVERLGDMGAEVIMQRVGKNRWTVRVFYNGIWRYAYDENLGPAICEAALKAVG